MELRTLRYFVAVAEELHFGRAATRLRMTQPPLSRAIRQLEAELGCALLHRSPQGVVLTPAGESLYIDARALLAQADHTRDRAVAAAGASVLRLGTLADSAEQAGATLADVFRNRHPGVEIRIREVDFTDPTAGLRSGTTDIALTRSPFDQTGLTVRVLRSDPIGVVLRSDDPLAARASLRRAELADRRWFRLPEDVDSAWRAFWMPFGGTREDGPVVRTIHECVQAVLWNDTVGLTSLGHSMPPGLTVVPVPDMPTSDLVIAWRTGDRNPLVRSFTRITEDIYRGRSIRSTSDRFTR
ncbi:LysR substrate-binding domain-containing protein [Nocardia pneumoniae]|uniref:LysR substrate-binding domain-containing protein n=1 Tax=Nocardia pneumoniae TaxID=228601 RepID=UPI000592F99C|nr:LysR substrate-binding domain-containing protein [Nocardia pneumoniae]